MGETVEFILFKVKSSLITFKGASTIDVSVPPNFEKFLEALLAFTQHPSQVGTVVDSFLRCS